MNKYYLEQYRKSKVNFFIETINSIDLNECDNFYLKKILVAKWFIKNFEIIDYTGFEEETLKIEDAKLEESMRNFIKENIILGEQNKGNIVFKHMNYKILLSFGENCRLCFSIITSNRKVESYELTSFLTPFDHQNIIEEIDQLFESLILKMQELIEEEEMYKEFESNDDKLREKIGNTLKELIINERY